MTSTIFTCYLERRITKFYLGTLPLSYSHFFSYGCIVDIYVSYYLRLQVCIYTDVLIRKWFLLMFCIRALVKILTHKVNQFVVCMYVLRATPTYHFDYIATGVCIYVVKTVNTYLSVRKAHIIKKERYL